MGTVICYIFIIYRSKNKIDKLHDLLNFRQKCKAKAIKFFVSNDINLANLKRVSELYNCQTIEGNLIYDLDVDIYSPCALGATINDTTIEQFKCEIVAGAANNQLQDEDKHANMLQEKGILYAPDFLINAGGLINVYSEINGYDREKAIAQTRKIYDTTLEIFSKSKEENITTHQAALKLAMERIAQAKN